MGLDPRLWVNTRFDEPRPCDIDAEANRVVTLPTPPYDPYPWQLLDNAWRIIRHVRGEAAEQAAYCRLLERKLSDLGIAVAELIEAAGGKS